MQARHIVVLAGFLTSTGALIASMPEWSALRSPIFIGGLLGQLGATVAGLYVTPPDKRL